MNEQQPRVADVGDVHIAYESFGSVEQPTILLVIGLATQMLAWDERFCQLLVDEGYQVIRFDNRDIGLSTHLGSLGVPDVMPALRGEPITAPYLLADMARDTVGLMDALQIDRAHVVGASMGGMIAQQVAIDHPDRVASLTSIMSTPNRSAGASTPEATAALLSPPARSEDEAAERAVAVYSVIGSPGYELDRERVAERARQAYRRGDDPGGVTRQFAAILASPDRVPGLRSLAVPTLVLHGDDDPLVAVDGGVTTAEAVPGARIVRFPGMGHDLPEGLWPQIVAEIVAHARAADEAAH
ncbi:MAG: alpha/beta fold hydrolase [Micrococcales bacterium]|nr:alpha/beta fold hydrolase [Micrococcales bacterium]